MSGDAGERWARKGSSHCPLILCISCSRLQKLGSWAGDVAQVVEYVLSIQEAMGSTVSAGLYKPGLVVPSYNPSTQEMEAKGLAEVQGHS